MSDAGSPTNLPGLAAQLSALAQARPDEPMLADSSRSFTTADVAGLAAGIAETIGPVEASEPIVVLADRSLESVIAMFGVLWAGGAVAAVDGSDTPDRLRAVCAQIGSTVAIDPRRHAGRSAPPPAIDGARVVDVSAMVRGGFAHREPAPNGASVILVTSGSSGRPKAVMRTGEQVARTQAWGANDPHIRPGCRSAVFTPPFYGWGYVELVSETCNGRFALLLDPLVDSPAEIADAVARWGTERIALTPSLARQLPALFGWSRPFQAVTTAFIGGEPVSWPDVTAVRSLINERAVVYTSYGASELLIQTHRSRIGPEVIAGVEPLALGFPLEPQYCTVEPMGDHPGRGELVVSDLVSDRYLGDPELTAQRFGVDADGRRFWRSGDIVEVSVDGSTRHLGRVDDMVKVNGKRVEPGEVEAALGAVPGIRAAAVTARTLPSGRQQLIGHVEAESGTTARFVWDYLRKRLPEHLCPAVLVRHDRLPVNDRGKVDRSVLRVSKLTPWRDSAPSSSSTREEVAALGMVARILDLPDLGLDDILWDVGCDSLAAIEIASALVDLTGRDLQPNELLSLRTVRELVARAMEADHPARDWIVEFNTDGTRDPVFVVAGAGGPALVLRLLIDELGTDQPLVVYEQRGLHQYETPDRSVRKMADRYLADIVRRKPHGPYVLVGRSFGGLVAHELARRLQRRNEHVVLVLLDTYRVPISEPDADRPQIPRPQRPPRLAVRSSPWPVHLLKLAVWRAVTAKRTLRPRLEARVPRWMSITAPIGSPARYGEMARLARAIARADRRPILTVPIWLVHHTGSVTPEQWADQPDLRLVETGGDHFSMMGSPHVVIVAEAVRAAQQAALCGGE